LFQDAGTLSTGELQRIPSARAICKGSKILLLDEVTSDLDAHSQSKVQCTIDELRKSCTVIVVAHRLKTVEEADTITVLDRGDILHFGGQDVRRYHATVASLEVATATSYHFMMSTLLAKIEQGTFGDRDRHFSAFEIPITRSGVGACKPVALDKYLNGGIVGSSSSSFWPSSKIERNANRSTHSGLLMK